MTEITEEQIDKYFAVVADIAYQELGYGITNQINGLALRGFEMQRRPIEQAPENIKCVVWFTDDLGKKQKTIAAFYTTLDCGEDCEDCTEDGFAPPDWYEESYEHECLRRMSFEPTEFILLSALGEPK